MPCFLPHRNAGGGEAGIGEGADGYSDVPRKAFALPVDRGTAYRTEREGQRFAAFGAPLPHRSLTGEGDLIAAESGLVADDGSCAPLALQTVAHRDARWFALNRKIELPATAGRVSDAHSSPLGANGIHKEECAKLQQEELEQTTEVDGHVIHLKQWGGQQQTGHFQIPKGIVTHTDMNALVFRLHYSEPIADNGDAVD